MVQFSWSDGAWQTKVGLVSTTHGSLVWFMALWFIIGVGWCMVRRVGGWHGMQAGVGSCRMVPYMGFGAGAFVGARL